MKFATNVLALCALCTTADAFTVQAPKTITTSLKMSSDYSYLGNMNGDDDKTGSRTMSQKSTPSKSVNGNLTPVDRYDDQPKTTQEVFQEASIITVQGGSLRTCSFDEGVDRVSVFLKTEGRPLNANVELWQGPDNSPQKMSVYLEDGSLRPFHCTVESPGSSNAVAIRNTGQMEFPLTAGLNVDMDGNAEGPGDILLTTSEYRTVQGGAVYTTPFPPSVQSVQVVLKTDGRPLNARVELLQGPNNNKQVMEVYTEDGQVRPFYVIIDTPGTGNVVRIVNTATVEFPLTAAIEAYLVDESLVDDTGMAAPGGMTWS